MGRGCYWANIIISGLWALQLIHLRVLNLMGTRECRARRRATTGTPGDQRVVSVVAALATTPGEDGLSCAPTVTLPAIPMSSLLKGRNAIKIETDK